MIFNIFYVIKEKKTNKYRVFKYVNIYIYICYTIKSKIKVNLLFNVFLFRSLVKKNQSSNTKVAPYVTMHCLDGEFIQKKKKSLLSGHILSFNFSFDAF